MVRKQISSLTHHPLLSYASSVGKLIRLCCSCCVYCKRRQKSWKYFIYVYIVFFAYIYSRHTYIPEVIYISVVTYICIFHICKYVIKSGKQAALAIIGRLSASRQRFTIEIKFLTFIAFSFSLLHSPWLRTPSL